MRVGQTEKVALTYIQYDIYAVCVKQWELAVEYKGPNLVLCDDLERWVGVRGGRLKKEGIYFNPWIGKIL